MARQRRARAAQLTAAGYGIPQLNQLMIRVFWVELNPPGGMSPELIRDSMPLEFDCTEDWLLNSLPWQFEQ